MQDRIDSVRSLLAEGLSHSQIAAALSISKDAVFRAVKRLKRQAELGALGYGPGLPGYITKQVSTNVGDSWVKQVKEPGEPFEMPAGQAVKGVSALVDADGRVVQQWIKTTKDSATADLVEALKESFAGLRGQSAPSVGPVHTDDALLSVYPVADAHLGLLAWGRETGSSFDLEVGCERLRSASRQLVEQARPSRQALILGLGDWTHADDTRNETPAHRHKLDVDSRFKRVIRAGVDLRRDMIEMALEKHDRVIVKDVPGNHDPHAYLALELAISAYYENNPRVIVDVEPGEHFFMRFGQTLLGAHHGHRAKADRLAMNMAVTRREDWGATRYHWILTGHVHHETAKEVGDCRVESFQTLADKDAFHAGGGYTAGQSLQCITLHREDGEVGRHRVNIPPPVQAALRVAA